MSERTLKVVLCLLPWALAGVILFLLTAWGDPVGMYRDAKTYQRSIVATHAGRDPYAEELALQQSAQKNGNMELTFIYGYPPVTLPFLHLLGNLPFGVYAGLYWLAYILGALAQLWAVFFLLSSTEQRLARYLLPFAMIFPILIYSKESLFGGNVEYILYGAILSAAAVGCRKKQWAWFYVAVLLSACAKPQMLTLLAIPVLAAAGQWGATVLTAVGSVSLVGAQRWIWPAEYTSWLHTVNMQFVLYNRDFGVGPLGIFGSALWKQGLSYQVP